MAGKNQVEVTFTGDSDQLEKAMARTGEAADAMSKTVDNASKRIGSSSADTSRSFDRVGEAADNLDTKAMGFRDGMTGVQDSMQGVSAIAKGDLFEGFFMLGAGIGDLGSSIYNLGVPALKAIKDWAGTAADAVSAFVSTTKGMLISLGGVGLAIGAAILVYEAFNSKADETVKVNQELANTLDSVSGAVTENTQSWVANELEAKGALEAARTLGVSYRDLVDAALGNADAHDRVFEAVARANEGVEAGTDRNTELNNALQTMLEGMEGVNTELVDAQAAWERTTVAIEGNTAGIVHQIDTLQELSDVLKAQSDPIFAFVDAQQRVKDAQDAVNAAVDEFGAGSSEHERALLDLAEAEIGLFDATGAAADAVGGSLIPALQQMADDGLISEAAFRELEEAIKAAEEAAHEADGTVVDITERYTTVYEQIGQAPVMGRNVPTLATGGISAGGLTLVGEEGPELVNLPTGSRVYSNAESMAMAAGMGWDGGGYGGGTTVLEVHSGGSRLDDALVEILSRAVRVRGGNVQLVLGRG